MTIVVVGSDWDLDLPKGDDWRICYLGNDYATLLKIAARFSGKGVVAPVADLLNEVAGRIAAPVINIDEQLVSGRVPLGWWSSDLGEPNPYMSDFLLDLCRGIVLVEASAKGGNHLVVVDNDRLGRSLVKVCRRAGLNASWRGASSKPLRYVWHILNAHLAFILAWLRQQRAIARHPASLKKLSDTTPWLMTWGTGVDLNSEPEEDHFFGAFPKLIRIAGYRACFLVHPVIWTAPIETIAANVAAARKPAAIVGAFIGFGALVRAYVAYAGFTLLALRRLKLADVDLTPLLRLALLREMASPRLLNAAVYAGLAAGIKRAGLAPRMLYYTFENQPWEKAMLAGFRRSLPATILVGVQHAPIAKQFLSGHPSARQWQDGTAPDLLLTIGEDFRQRLIDQGAPQDRVKVGGATRFPQVFSNSNSSRTSNDGSGKLILASCPANISQSLDLVYKAAVAIAGFEGIRLIVNLHPFVEPDFEALLRDKLMKCGAPRNFEFVDGSAREWLSKVDVLLYNSSTTCFEAIAAGTVPIYVGPSAGLDLGNIPSEVGLDCRSSEELAQLVRRVILDPEFRKDRLAAAGFWLGRCLAKPAPETWLALAQQVAH